MQLTMGKALALIFTGCGIMLLCNFCIFFLVDNVRRNRNRNRGSIIRKRSNRRKSVSFTNPLVKQTVGQSNPSPGEEIEMVDLGSSRAQSNPPPPCSYSFAAIQTNEHHTTSANASSSNPQRGKTCQTGCFETKQSCSCYPHTPNDQNKLSYGPTPYASTFYGQKYVYETATQVFML